MTLRERITIKADAETIWALLADPDHWRDWNPKFISLHRNRTGLVVAGEQFSMVSQMKRSKRPSEVIVREVMPLRRVKVDQIFSHKNRTRHIQVNLELKAGKGGIEVSQTIDQQHAGIPFPLQLLFWFVHRFGTPVGVPPLNRLKALAEAA